MRIEGFSCFIRAVYSMPDEAARFRDLCWVCSCRRAREKYAKTGAVWRVVVKLYPAAMAVHDFSDDCQSQADTVFFRGIEWIEDLLPQFGGNTRAGIFHGDDEAGPATGRFRRDPQSQDTFAGLPSRMGGLHRLVGVVN